MKPGAELDELVRDKIFVNPIREDGTCTTVGIIGAPPYSTDISAAWDVVEKMLSEGWEFYLEGEFCCSFAGGIGVGSFSSINATAPHAICLAALAAKGVEIET